MLALDRGALLILRLSTRRDESMLALRPWRTPDPAIVDSLRRANVSSGQFATLGLAAADSLRRASARSGVPHSAPIT